LPVRPAFGPIRDDDRALALRGDDPILLAQMVSRRSKSKELEHGRGVTITHGLFSPDGRRAATAGEDRTVRLWDAANGRAIVSPFPHPTDIRRIAFSPDGRYLSVVSADHRAWLWDCAVGSPASRRLRVNQKFGVWQTYPRFNRDARRLTALFRDDPESDAQVPFLLPAMWDTDTGDLVQLDIAEDSLIQTAFSSDGAYLATADRNGRVWIHDLANGQRVRSRTYKGEVLYLAFSGEGWHLLSVIDPGPGNADKGAVADKKLEAHVWQWNQEDSRSLPFSGGARLLLSPDGSRLAIAPTKAAMEVRDVATGRSIELRSPPPEGEVGLMAFSGDSCVLLTVFKDKSAQLWDLRTGDLLNKDNPIVHDEAIFQAKFSTDNRYVLTASARRLRPGERPTADNQGEGEVRVWEAATGRAVSEVMKHAGPVYHAAFSADGRWVVSACDNAEFFRHEARLWDADSGTPLTPVLTALGNCSDVALSPDGRRLLTVSFEGNVHEWPLDALVGSASEASSAAEVLSGRRIDSSDTARELEAASWKDTWKTLRDKQAPFLRRASEAEVKTWHLEALDDCHWDKQWRAAALHLQYLINHGEDTSQRRHEQALAFLLAGDGSAYRRACEESWQRFRNSRQADDLSQIVRTWPVRPVPMDRQGRLVQIPRNAVELRQGNPFCTQHHVLGAALYRAGKYEEAIRELQTAEGLCRRRPYPWDLLFLALAYHQQGNKEEARGAWNKFIDRMRQDKDASGWLLKLDPMESMELEILRREGENLGLAATPKT
jgi:WD40 repeat protein